MDKDQIKKLKQFADPHQLTGLNEICEFSDLKKDDNVFESIKNYNTLYKTDKGLWTIFGKGKGIDNWTCLEIGSSKDIKSEIRQMLNLMISKSERQDVKTTFHEKVYSFCTYKDKKSIKYQSMYRLCKEFVVYEIDVPKYLNGIDAGKYNEVEYAEVKFACETEALYWNPALAANGNKEREILSNIFEQK